MDTSLETGPCTAHGTVGAKDMPLGGSRAGSVGGSRSCSQLREPRNADVGLSMLKWFESK